MSSITMTKGWASDRLKDVAAINAVTLSAGTDPNYEFDYLEISNVDYHGIVDPNAIEHLRFEDAPSRARRRVAARSTVISSVRPNLQAIAFFPDAPAHFVCSTGFNVVEPKVSRLSPQFAYYYLISENARQYFEAAATGVGYPAVGDKAFNAIDVPLPPLPEQRNIAAYLDASCAAIDAAVDAKHRQIGILDVLRTTLIYEAVTQGINRSATTVVHDIPSYGRTPKHWKRSKLRYEISIQNGDFASDKLQEGGAYPILGGNGVMGHTDLSNVDGETVVIGRVGAYCGNAHYVQGKVWVSDNALIVKSRHYARFLCHLFNALNFNAQANNTAQPVITGTKIKNTYIVLPPLAEQETICTVLDEKLAEVKLIATGIESQITTLTAYRKSLIHECVTGQAAGDGRGCAACGAYQQHIHRRTQDMTKRKSIKRTTEADLSIHKQTDLLTEVRELILQAREDVARTVDASLTTLYWYIGRRIRQDILKEKRAEYGGQIVSALGRQLEMEFGRGFGEKNLRRMIQFSETFPDEKIVAALRRQLGWTHFKAIIPMTDPLKRDFYAEMCRIERWSTRTLEKKIGSMLFERTALSRKPEKLAEMELKQLREEDKVTPDLIFRDPYLLDFLGLKDSYAEKDIEAAILREMESFILELGVGFAFLERQKRITVGNTDYYLDLLFYHRPLRRLVVIELKLDDFKPGDKGQMELYLNWLDRYERREGEEKPIGLILCAGKNQETVELLGMEQSGIQVSSYWTEALPKQQLEHKLREAVRLARVRLKADED